jgi:3-oxoacid CoA-transferase subunit A
MNKFYFMADFHGSSEPIENLKNRLAANAIPLDETDTVVVLGDLGANYYGQNSEQDKYFKQKLNDIGCKIFAIRGNHEERPSKLCSEDKVQSLGNWAMTKAYGYMVYVEKDYPNIFYSLDTPSIYRFNGLSVLTLPGAYSVDKNYRLANGWNWFPEEQMSTLEKSIADSLCQARDWTFDLVLSHTCPLEYEPTDLFIEGIDQSTVDRSTEEFLSKLNNKLHYKYWLFGHFHKFRLYPEVEGRTQLMLYNDNAVELNDLFNESLNEIKLY